VVIFTSEECDGEREYCQKKGTPHPGETGRSFSFA